MSTPKGALGGVKRLSTQKTSAVLRKAGFTSGGRIGRGRYAYFRPGYRVSREFGGAIMVHYWCGAVSEATTASIEQYQEALEAAGLAAEVCGWRVSKGERYPCSLRVKYPEPSQPAGEARPEAGAGQ